MSLYEQGFRLVPDLSTSFMVDTIELLAYYSGMSKRRTLSSDLTTSSAFVMMPPTAQILFVQLYLSADDDGFCEYYSIMRMCDAKPDDLKVLKAKKFVHIFDEEVLHIVEWYTHSYIQPDRYQPSKYLEKYKEYTSCVHRVHNLEHGDTVLSIYNIKQRGQLIRKLDGKYSDDFLAFWEAYPNKSAKKAAFRMWIRIKNVRDLLPEMLKALEEQKKSDRWMKDSGQFIPHPATWLNGERWKDQLALPMLQGPGSLIIE